MGSKTIICSLIMGVAGFFAGRICSTDRHTLKVEKWRDTVVVHQPEVMVIRSLAPSIERLATARDTCHDTIEVFVPREQHEYRGEDYRVWVSGYRPALDSLKLELPVVMAKPSTRRWSVGIHAGVGMTPKGVQPYIGLGVSFKLY